MTNAQIDLLIEYTKYSVRFVPIADQDVVSTLIDLGFLVKVKSKVGFTVKGTSEGKALADIQKQMLSLTDAFLTK